MLVVYFAIGAVIGIALSASLFYTGYITGRKER